MDSFIPKYLLSAFYVPRKNEYNTVPNLKEITDWDYAPQGP